MYRLELSFMALQNLNNVFIGSVGWSVKIS